MHKLRNIFLLVVALFLTSATISALAASGDQFAMKEVKVVDYNTLKVSFNRDLLEDTSTFEFLLIPKSNDTKGIALTGITLSGSNELTMKTMEALKSNEEYNIIVVFASDKEGKTIENGIDGMITFKVPASFSDSTSASGKIDIASDNSPTLTDGNNLATTPNNESDKANTPENGTVNPMNNAPVTDTSVATGGLTPENAATNANPTEIKTGPAETLIVIMAFLLGLAFMYFRKRAGQS